MRILGWGQIVIGAAIAVLWVLLLATGQVPEVDQGRVDIWFHLVAELGMAMVLLGAGLAALRRTARAHLLSALAIGMLVYSAVNSPGYYAESGDWAMVAAFGLVVAAGVAAFIALCRRDAASSAATDREDREAVQESVGRAEVGAP